VLGFLNNFLGLGFSQVKKLQEIMCESRPLKYKGVALEIKKRKRKFIQGLKRKK